MNNKKVHLRTKVKRKAIKDVIRFYILISKLSFNLRHTQNVNGSVS